MNKLALGLKQFWQEEDGVTAIEYGLIAALIAIVIIAAVGMAGGRIACNFQRIADCLVGSTHGTCATACT